VVCDQAANIKKAFSETTEAEDRNGGFNLVQLTKDLLLQQKQRDAVEKQKSIEKSILKEIEDMNRFTGNSGSKRKRNEILEDLDEFEDTLSELSDSESDDDDDDFDVLNNELNRLSKFFNLKINHSNFR
jgi:hypothetical protein